jgi:hypothetical protein
VLEAALGGDASSTANPSVTTSGPMPSPAITATLIEVGAAVVVAWVAVTALSSWTSG